MLKQQLIAACLFFTTATGLQLVRDQADLEGRITQEVLSDFLLVKSGSQCGRCIALETLMEKLEKYISMPVFLIRSKAIQQPVLELHKLSSADEAGFETIPYDGHMTGSGILKFLQDVTLARQAGFSDHPLKNRSVESVESAIERSQKTGGRVPFICEVRDDRDIEFYEGVIKKAGLENADFYVLKNAGAKEPRIIVAHSDEVRLSTSAEVEADIIRWLKIEKFAQFGKLRLLSDREKDENKSWIVLIGEKDSYELFQHEFREFASKNRDQWRTGWIDKELGDWEKNVENILNIGEDLATFGRLIDEGGAASWNCKQDCVIGRNDNVIKYMSTTNLSSSKIEEFAQSFTGGRSGSGSTQEASQVADLKVEFESRDLGIVRLSSADFSQKVLTTHDPVLVLLRAADGEQSVELRSVVESVADILLPNNRIKFYEMTDLPPPDSRYAAYERIPHLWFKPLGVNENPLSIPWESSAAEEAKENLLASAVKRTFAALERNFAALTRKYLIKLKAILDRLISSLNIGEEL